MSHFRDSQSYTKFANNSGSGLDREAKRNSLSHRRSKEKIENVDESPVTPDSTTEPPRPAHDFQEGEDVFYCTEEGQNMLGTVGQVTQSRCQILFGDGTEAWAPLKRIKKLSCSFSEEGPSPPGRSADESPRPSTRDQVKTDMVCSVCKSVKKMSSKKARSYANTLYKCNRCSSTKIDSTPVLTLNHNHHTAAAAIQKKLSLSRQIVKRTSTVEPTPSPPKQIQQHGKSTSLNHLGMNLQPGGDVSIRPILNITNSSSATTTQYLQTSSSPLPHRQPSSPINPSNMLMTVPHHRPQMNSPQINSRSSTVIPNQNHIQQQHMRVPGQGVPLQMPSPGKNTRTNLCFHCSQRTCPYDRVHCNMCGLYCHLQCLSLTPQPLEGDKFWDVMCSACGTQNGTEKGGNKVFSVRRGITSWSDVVHLIINCLKAKALGQQYFDFDNQIMPFFDNNIDKLHLPRQYKVVPREERKTNLLTALTNSKFRFSKNKTEMKKAGSSWALRSDHTASSRPKSDYPDAIPSTTTTTTHTKNIHVNDKDIIPLPNQVRSPNAISYSKNLQGLPTKLTDIDPSSRPSYLTLHPNQSQSSNLDKSPVPRNIQRDKMDTPPYLSSTPFVKYKNPSFGTPVSNKTPQSLNTSTSPCTPTTPTTTIHSPNNNVATSFPRVLSKEVLLRNPIITTNIILSPTKITIQGQGTKTVGLTTSDCDKRIQGKDPRISPNTTNKNKALDRSTKLKNTRRKVGRPSKQKDKPENKFKLKARASLKSSVVSSDTSINVHRQRLRIRLPVKPPGDSNNSKQDTSDGTSSTTEPSSSSSAFTVTHPLLPNCLTHSSIQEQKLLALPTSTSPSKEIRPKKRAYITDTVNSTKGQNLNNSSLVPSIHPLPLDGLSHESVGGLNGLTKSITMSGGKSTKLGQTSNTNNFIKNRKPNFSNQISNNNPFHNYEGMMENENQVDDCGVELTVFRQNLLDACVYGGLKAQCLPNLPKSKAEVEKRIGEYFTAEVGGGDNCNFSSPNNEIGFDSGTNSSSIKRLFCNWPSRHNYPPNNFYPSGYTANSNNNDNGNSSCVSPMKRVGGVKRKLSIGKKSERNLDDLDSYDIIAMRVGEDGVVRYEVAWLNEVAFESEEDDMEVDLKEDITQYQNQSKEVDTMMEIDDKESIKAAMNGSVAVSPVKFEELQDSSNGTDISIKKEKQGVTPTTTGNVALKNGHRKLSVSSQQQQQQPTSSSKRDPLFIDLTDSP